MKTAEWKTTRRYSLCFPRDQFGREGVVHVRDNSIPHRDGNIVAVCPTGEVADKVRQLLEDHDGAEWVRMKNAELECANP